MFFHASSRLIAPVRTARRSSLIPTDGTIIAAPEKEKGVHIIGGKLEIARLDNIDDDDVREAYRLHTQTNQDEFLFPLALAVDRS